jgi:hypothetical protein
MYLSAGPLATILGGCRRFPGSVPSPGETPARYYRDQVGSFLPGARRPNLVANPNLPESERTFLRWFNTSAFAFPATPFALGDVSRTLPNTRRPGFQIWDISLQKNTRLREGINLEFRTEFFNAFNKTNFLRTEYAPVRQCRSSDRSRRRARRVRFSLH